MQRIKTYRPFSTRIVERRYLRARAFNYLKEQHANFIGRAELFYDDAAILYSNELLNLQVVSLSIINSTLILDNHPF